MINGEIKNKVDALWNDFAAGGLTNPLEVIEQRSEEHTSELQSRE